jgi:hypothetical protein
MSDNAKLAIIFSVVVVFVSLFGIMLDYEQYEKEIIRIESKGITCECPRYASAAFIRNPQKFLAESDTTFFSRKEYAKVADNYIVKIPK